MTNDEIKKMIELYFDGELEKNSEPVLFTILSESDEGREYFRQLNLIHSAASDDMQEFPSPLEERIFHAIEKTHVNVPEIYKRNIWFSAASLSIAAVMLIISLILFFELSDYRNRVDIVSDQVRLQNQTLELILNNSLPQAEVETRRVNEIVVKPKI